MGESGRSCTADGKEPVRNGGRGGNVDSPGDLPFPPPSPVTGPADTGVAPARAAAE